MTQRDVRKIAATRFSHCSRKGLASVVFTMLFFTIVLSGCISNGTQANGAMTIEDVLARWNTAFKEIHTLRGSQRMEALPEEGPQQTTPNSSNTNSDPKGVLQSTSEIYEIQEGNSRFHFVAHYSEVDETTVWDGTNAYRYRPWLNEVYCPLPESYASGAYWGDDVDDLSLLAVLRPVRDNRLLASSPYDLVGTGELDGRKVIELIVKPGWRTMPAALEGTHIYLDAVTYLPYRIVTPSFLSNPVHGQFERTVTNLEINPAVTDKDFALDLPPGTVTVYEQAPWAPKIRVYGSPQDAAEQAGFPLFIPDKGEVKETYAMYMAEKEGNFSPVVAFLFPDNTILLEGPYLPKGNRRWPSYDKRIVGKPEVMFVDGQEVILQLGKDGIGIITLEKQGTLIEISGKINQERAVQLVRSLQQL